MFRFNNLLKNELFDKHFLKNVGLLAFLAEHLLQTASISLKNHLRHFQKYTQNIYKIYRTSKKQAKIEYNIIKELQQHH